MIDTTSTSPESGALELERIFKAPPGRVFDAFSSGDALKRWFGPGYCGVISAEVDFRVGGTYRMRLNTEHAGEVDLVGSYRAIERPGRLSFTWRWEDNPAFNPCDSVVEITFGEHPEGTLLRLVQTGIEGAEDRANHGAGWAGSFEKLESQFS